MRTSVFVFFLFLSFAAAAQARLQYGSLNWSKDGRQILFSCIEVRPGQQNVSPFNWRLYRYDLNRDKLELIDKAAMFGAFSPDGGQVAYSKNTGASWDLYIKNLASGRKRKLTDTPQQESAPDWSPDGRMIVFTKGLKQNLSSIYSMDPQGGNVRNLSQNGRFECKNPRFSPGGDKVVYSMQKGDKRDQAYVMELLSGFTRNVTRDMNNNYNPGWFDSQSLLYIREKGELCIKEVEGGPASVVEGIRTPFARYNARRKEIAYIGSDGQSIYVQKLKGRAGRLKQGKAERVISPELIRGR